MQSTNTFSTQMARLKAALQIKEDQEVAELLGMSKAALSARKARDSFPAEKLRALVQSSPELNIDVDYVLTGVAQAALEIIRAAQAGTPLVKVGGAELQLLENYRLCSRPDQEALRHQAQFLAHRTPLTPDGLYPKRGDEPAPTLHQSRKKAL
jgi:transcriptional regulator with XRE-family HTH domain